MTLSVLLQFSFFYFASRPLPSSSLLSYSRSRRALARHNLQEWRSFDWPLTIRHCRLFPYIHHKKFSSFLRSSYSVRLRHRQRHSRRWRKPLLPRQRGGETQGLDSCREKSETSAILHRKNPKFLPFSRKNTRFHEHDPRSSSSIYTSLGQCPTFHASKGAWKRDEKEIPRGIARFTKGLKKRWKRNSLRHSKH